MNDGEVQIRVLSEMIRKWAHSKKAFITFDAYLQEIALWKKLTGIHQVRRILEIGSGSGWFLTVAVALGFAEEGVGVDPAFSEEGTHIDEVRTTESVISRLDLSDRVHFRICTLADFLPKALFEGERYDLLVFRNTLHHIPTIKRKSQIL